MSETWTFLGGLGLGWGLGVWTVIALYWAMHRSPLDAATRQGEVR